MISIDSYSAFLQCANVSVNNLAAAYIEFNGGNIERAMQEAEMHGLLLNGSVTGEGSIIAETICSPQKAIVASNSTFGAAPLCVFSFRNGYWVLTTVNYAQKSVNLIEAIPQSEIKKVVKDALIGDMQILNFSPFTLTLTNDEMELFNLSLMLLNNRRNNKGAPLVPEDTYFNFQDLIMGKEFASIALIEDVACDNSTIFSLVGDPDRCFAAFNGLLNKQIFAKCKFEGYCQPAINMFYRLAPLKGMVILSYKDIATEVGHKYYVFPDSIMELSADNNSITFTAVKDIDYSIWE